ncbi:olfactory receptor 1165-like [Hippopotamus amphibius kiboko]|uniref:olfactory receptor 1165-like n=1 Tax=Hippopotamus amphibius kiboko TaxID=575201 RepID=UPI002593594E|nr:olfactory receptor 1165-like [Hippopotamus amphibius kiboko]
MNSLIFSSRKVVMDEGNHSAGISFILLGFSEYPHIQVPLFLVFLAIYTVSVMGNLGMIAIIRIDPKLHTPMYFFLSHLSFVDFCYSSVLTPKLLEILVVDIRTISYVGCMIQFFFGCTLVITEIFMLAVMAYDRFVAVCNPLIYTVAMSPKLCTLLVAGTYSWGGICSLTITYSLLELSFCGSNLIHHFGCEYSAIISASCSDPSFSQMTCFIISTLNEVCSLLIILGSYVFIVVTIIKMPSAGGLRKAFSTCASHLTAITIFHGTILLLYCVPNSKSSRLFIKVATVFYTVVIPMLNPLIYSLRNNDVKETVRKLINNKLFSQSM